DFVASCLPRLNIAGFCIATPTFEPTQRPCPAIDNMAAVDVDKYFSYDARLASFQKSSKKRGSTAGGRGKALNWPHKQIAPASLAKAGFYFDPSPESPDNVVCFLCDKGLDGWESGDDPLLEHLKHASHCGWAVVAAIEAEVGDYEKADPGQPHMVEARKATFAGRWPHDGKRGWKCKTKQLVDAGWKYTPTAESADMATCTYCQLALDGWEPSDKPYDEHYNRSPGCAFFTLMSQFEGAPRKKTDRAKAAPKSRSSRLSAQSVATTLASDALSVTDATADVEDSVVTTASTMTQGGRKTKGKKGAAAKGSRSKAKKNEPVEAEVVDQPEEVAPEPQPPKASRGKKRGSEAIDDSVVFISEGAALKKRATRTRSSTVTNTSTVIPDEGEMTDAPGPAGKNFARNKGRGSNAASRAISTISTASMASLRKPTCDFPDDEEIERQLEADLEREWSEDDEIAHDSECEANRTNGGAAVQVSADYAMFDPIANEPDEADVEEELRALQAEMAVEEPEQLHVPKKGRKAGSRKASKQTAPPRPVLASQHVAEPPSTPAKVISPAPSARQPVISPSPSPQSSDAENQPPSSKPTASATGKKTVLAPVSETPIRSSPSKRNVLAGLQSTTPWTAVSLDAVVATPRVGVDKENAVERLLKQGRDLTSPEKHMTVEEWIYFNAGEAEKKLKHECEAMVNLFEREGTRAMNVLEGLSAD
ncbi:Protein bir1, partial [Tolypocladium capitatum]